MARVDSYDRAAPTPAIGSRWIWELGKPHAQESITVTRVEWNGEEWWVESGPAAERLFWSDLSRFWEAVSPVR